MYQTDKKSLLKQVKVKQLKKNKLRYNEYYNMQPIFDQLYKQSQEGSIFNHLFNLITKDENIILAYRSIKSNQGSKTSGTNRHTINYIENMPSMEYINYIKNRLNNYIPQKVRRVEIPKPNGKMRPLGIPCIEDRLIQQCIKQILEPICEAKFFAHSYGFRPNRSTEHAIGYMYKKINMDKCYWVVDIDVKGFFDHVTHSKLMKQMWALGIHDKKLLCIIGAMLKAEIEGIGIPTEGVPQGGILSPLLSNIVLNELDWWISTQWQSFPTRKEHRLQSNKYQHLRRSELKEIYIVRYADDFKIFCKTKDAAEKIFKATDQWLKERLGLEISPEKSKITDVRKNASEFLGFTIKAVKKGKKWVVSSHMTEKACEHATETLKKQAKTIKRYQTGNTVYTYNRLVVGLQNYYSLASEVCKDFRKINYNLLNSRYMKFKAIRTKDGITSIEYSKRYTGYRGEKIFICKQILYPVSFVQTKPPRLFNQDINNFSPKGREIIHDKLGYINKQILKYLAQNPLQSKSVEYNDNRLSLYSTQKGKCAITGLPLDLSMEVHHIQPIEQGGSDKYKNLIIVIYEIHKLIHATNKYLIKEYLKGIETTKALIDKINKFRLKIGNEIIVSDF